MRAAVIAATAALSLAMISASQAAILIRIDKAAQRMTVSVDGQVTYAWPVSTGRSGYRTPSGTFSAFRMEKDHFSKEWDDAPMPYSIFFTKAGHAIHGSYETKRLGSPASHGCVRLAPANAAKLFALVKSHGMADTKVVVAGSEPIVARHETPRKPAPQRLQPPPQEPAMLPPPVDAGYGWGWHQPEYVPFRRWD